MQKARMDRSRLFRRLAAGLGLVVFGSLGCAPGYMKAEDLDHAEQGPKHCAARCHELGMTMGALVLVGDQLPGCVCQPRGSLPAATTEGASAATTGYGVVLAAAAAAREQQAQQEWQRQQEQQRRQQQTNKMN